MSTGIRNRRLRWIKANRRMPGDSQTGTAGRRGGAGVDPQPRDGGQYIAGKDQWQTAPLPWGNSGIAQNRLERAARSVGRDLKAFAARTRAHAHVCAEPLKIDAGAMSATEGDRAVRQRKFLLAAPSHVEARGRGRVQCNPAAVDADLDTRMREPDEASMRAPRSWSSIAASRADDGAGRPWQRRNQRSRLRARWGVRAGQARRVASVAPLDRALRVLLRELVQQACGFRLVRRGAGERLASAAERRWRGAGRTSAARSCAWRRVGVAFVVDPGEPGFARVGIDAGARDRRAAAATRLRRRACSRSAGIAAKPCGPAPRSSCSSSVSAWSSAWWASATTGRRSSAACASAA